MPKDGLARIGHLRSSGEGGSVVRNVVAVREAVANKRIEVGAGINVLIVGGEVV